MKLKRTTRSYLQQSYERQIIELTKKYVDRKNFRLNEKIAYSKAKDFGWIEEIFVNMPKKKTGRVSKWDIDLIRKEASKYSKRSGIWETLPTSLQNRS